MAAITVSGRNDAAPAQDGTPATATAPDSGTITGTVTDIGTDEPLADDYVVVGWDDVQRAGITDADGQDTVSNVPAGETVDVLGFQGGGYRYHIRPVHHTGRAPAFSNQSSPS